MKTASKIVALSVCACALSLGQPLWPEQRQAFEAEEQDPLVPVAEREWSRKAGAPIRVVSLPKEQEPVSRGAGTVSVHALEHERHISSKSRKLVEKAEQQIRRQELDEARKTLDEAFALEDARPYALAISASMRLTEYIRGKKDPKLVSEALVELTEATPMLASDVGAQSNLGLAYYFTGDLDRALAETNKALQMDPARARTRYVLGTILCAQGRFSEAAFHLKQAASEIKAAQELLPDVERLAAAAAANQ